MPQDADVDLSVLSSHRKLRLYAAVLDELINRGVVRSRNAPAGDLAETLVARAYAAQLAPRSAKSWDVLVPGRAPLAGEVPANRGKAPAPELLAY